MFYQASIQLCQSLKSPIRSIKLWSNSVGPSNHHSFWFPFVFLAASSRRYGTVPHDRKKDWSCIIVIILSFKLPPYRQVSPRLNALLDRLVGCISQRTDCNWGRRGKKEGVDSLCSAVKKLSESSLRRAQEGFGGVLWLTSLAACIRIVTWQQSGAVIDGFCRGIQCWGFRVIALAGPRFLNWALGYQSEVVLRFWILWKLTLLADWFLSNNSGLCGNSNCKITVFGPGFICSLLDRPDYYSLAADFTDFEVTKLKSKRWLNSIEERLASFEKESWKNRKQSRENQNIWAQKGEEGIEGGIGRIEEGIGKKWKSQCIQIIWSRHSCTY